MNKATIRQIEMWLDSRYNIALHTDERMGNNDDEEFLPNNPDIIFYKGAIKMLECAGFSWTRDSKGKHIVYK